MKECEVALHLGVVCNREDSGVWAIVAQQRGHAALPGGVRDVWRRQHAP
jgi:hypothetical protein